MADFKPSLSNRILEFLARPKYKPLKQHELAAKLNVRGSGRQSLRKALYQLERDGKVVRLRKNRWALSGGDSSRQLAGTLRIHTRGYGFVVPDNPSLADVFIPDDRLGVGLPGDRVLVELDGKPLCRTPVEVGEQSKRVTGRVIRVLMRHTLTVTGLLKRGPTYWYVIPDNQRILQNIKTEPGDSPDIEFVDGQKVAVRLHEWERPHQPLKGTVEEDLGAAGTHEADIACILRSHGIESSFSDEVMKEVPEGPESSTPDTDGRVDLCDELTFTIDPEEAKDFDDAVSIRSVADGWELGVHIADVAHYVKPGSQTDREAYDRGTSVYLVDRVIPMLPGKLTTDICSLKPNVDRLTHSVWITITPEGNVLNARTARSVICSRARLTYEKVQAYLDNNENNDIPDAVCEALTIVHRVAVILRRKRIKEGSIDLAMPEVRCILDEEGHTIEIKKRTSFEAYQLIEECMLAANRAVAELFTKREVPGLYRIHEEPNEDQWAQMSAELSSLGIPVSPENRDDINRVAHQVADAPMQYNAQLAMLRNFKRAMYAAYRAEHFGLAFQDYTHFTSPIRRYPDLIVHRILCAIEDNEAPPCSAEELARIAQHCSVKERDADDAETESIKAARIDYYQRLLQNKEIGPFNAVISTIVSRGLIVELQDTLQRGLVPFASMNRDYYEVDPRKTSAKGRRGGGEWKIGQSLRVLLTRVDAAQGFVDFRLADESEPAPAKGKRTKGSKAHKKKKRRRGRR